MQSIRRESGLQITLPDDFEGFWRNPDNYALTTGICSVIA
jgi:hypothetical protein